MIPSGIKSVGTRNLELKKVDAGLYIVENAYEGEYHFFARSKAADGSAPCTEAGLPDTLSTVNDKSLALDKEA